MKTEFYYVIPDIHGRNDLLQKALGHLYREHPDGAAIIFLGDYIDRGHDNAGVLRTVMNPPENWKFTCLMGNHEEMFVDSYLRRDIFYDIKAAKDIAGFDQTVSISYDEVHDSIEPELIKWMQDLPLFCIQDQNVFVHAYYDDDLEAGRQSKHTCLWTRMPDSTPYDNSNQGFYLVHGHTPRGNGPIKSINRLNLDCGAVFYDRLVVAKFEIGKKGEVDFLEFT